MKLDLVEIEADGIIMDRALRDHVLDARLAAGLGPPIGVVPWVPSGAALDRLAPFLDPKIVDHAREVHQLAEQVKALKPYDWSIFAVRCGEDTPVIYKLYARPRGHGWLHVESSILGMTAKPYLWDRKDSPHLTDARWTELRSRCVEGDLSALAGLTADDPMSKPSLHGFMRLAKARLKSLGVKPIVPMRWSRGWEPLS